jgi:hypothetical protein
MTNLGDGCSTPIQFGITTRPSSILHAERKQSSALRLPMVILDDSLHPGICQQYGNLVTTVAQAASLQQVVIQPVKPGTRE